MDETSNESTAVANDNVANEEGTGEDAILGITPLNLKMLLMAERYKNLSALDADDDLDDQDPTTPASTTSVSVKKPTTKWGKLSFAVVGNKSLRKNSMIKNQSSHGSSSSSKENFEVLNRLHSQEGGGDTANHNEEANGPMGEVKQDNAETEAREDRASSFDEEDALEYWDQLTIPEPPPLPPIQQTLPASAQIVSPTVVPTTADGPPQIDSTAAPAVLSPPASSPLSLMHPSTIGNNANNNNNNNNASANQTEVPGEGLGLAQGQGLPGSDTGILAPSSSSSADRDGVAPGPGLGLGSALGVNDSSLPAVLPAERVVTVLVPAQTVETLTFVPPPPPTFETEFDMGSQGE